MARYRRYRKYTRRNRGRWSTNIQELGTTTILVNNQGAFYKDFTLAFNPLQTNTATSQVYTVKNIEVTFEVSRISDGGSPDGDKLEDITAYIMYVPQGMSLSTDYNLQHPEYIMAYKFLGSPTTDSPTSMAQPTKIKTRLSRRLQTGDSVILFIKGNNTNSSTPYAQRCEFHGISRWWTKAN